MFERGGGALRRFFTRRRSDCGNGGSLTGRCAAWKSVRPTFGNCTNVGAAYNVSMNADGRPSDESAAPLTALLLAGRREGRDELARTAGYSHKALITVAGVPLIARVLDSLRAVVRIGHVVISIDDVSVLRNVDAAAGLEVHASRVTPAASVADYLRTRPEGGPVLVTTADHALLSAEMLAYFCGEADDIEADVVVGVVTESVFRAQYPESRRTFVALKGERLCGANLFLLRTPAAARAVHFWERAGQFRKRPWRLASLFGVWNLLRFACGRLDRRTVIDRVSRVIGARVEVVELPFAEAAIDVDTPDDLETVERILAARADARAESTRPGGRKIIQGGAHGR